MNFKDFAQQLETKIQTSYEEGTTLEQAERLAAEFLHAQIVVSKQLKSFDLDARMRKTGVKAIRAAIYMESANHPVKKPTEAMLASMVDSHEVVQSEQNEFDKAEVSRADLERYYDIFANAHIYYRGIAKGNFGG